MRNIKSISKRALAVIFVCSLLLSISPTAFAGNGNGNGNKNFPGQYNTTQLIVKYKDPSQSAATDKNVKKQVGGKVKSTTKMNNGQHNGADKGNSAGNGNVAYLAIVQADSVDSMGEVIDAYEADPNVAYAAPNYEMTLFGETDASDTATDTTVVSETETTGAATAAVTETSAGTNADTTEASINESDTGTSETDTSASDTSVTETGETTAVDNTVVSPTVDNSVILPPNAASEPRYGDQWGLNNVGQTVNGKTGTSGIDIHASSAWCISQGKDVTVAVVDTGIDTSHPDLKNNIADGGYNFLDNNSDVTPSSSSETHGTAVAGLIAAECNGSGIIGAAPQAKILPLKVSNGGTVLTSDVISAIEYADSMGVKVCNMSFGSPDYNVALKDAMTDANMLFVCASGNTDTGSVCYPAGFSLPNTIAVGAIDSTGQVTSYTSSGTLNDVYAPGDNMLSTAPGNKYDYVSGTSFAVPMVSAIAAMTLSAVPNLSVIALQLSLKNGVSKVTEPDGQSVGIANAYAALVNALPLKYLNDTDGNIQRAMRYSGKLITAGVASIITRCKQWDQLNDSEQAVMADYFGVTADSMALCAGMGLDLLGSGIVANIAKGLGISEADAFTWQQMHGDKDAFDKQVTEFETWLSRGLLTDDEKATVYNLMVADKNNQISYLESAYIVAQVTGITLTDLFMSPSTPVTDTTVSGDESTDTAATDTTVSGGDDSGNATDTTSAVISSDTGTKETVTTSTALTTDDSTDTVTLATTAVSDEGSTADTSGTAATVDEGADANSTASTTVSTVDSNDESTVATTAITDSENTATAATTTVTTATTAVSGDESSTDVTSDTTVSDDGNTDTTTPDITTAPIDEDALFMALVHMYHVKADQLQGYLTAQSMLPSELQTSIQQWQAQNNFYVVNGELSLCSFSPSDKINLMLAGDSKYNTNMNGSWTDGLSQIDQVTGEMSYTQNLLSLSGRNGLDLNLNLRFDSQESDSGSNVVQPLVNEKATITYYGGTSCSYSNTVPAQNSSDTLSMHEVANDLSVADSNANVTAYSTVVDSNGNPVTATTAMINDCTVIWDNYENYRYELGDGVSLSLPSLEPMYNNKSIGSLSYLHMPDGSIYKVLLNDNASTYTIEGLVADTMSFNKDTTFNNGNGKTSVFSLTVMDEVTYYFDSNGRYLGVKDLYGNTIHVWYNSNGLIYRIYDSTWTNGTPGRYIEFAYNGTENNDRTVTMTFFDEGSNVGTLLYTFNIAHDPNSDSPSLASIQQYIDATQSKTTSFNVSDKSVLYHINSRSPIASKVDLPGIYKEITKITTPTGLEYNYDYFDTSIYQKAYGLASTRDYSCVKNTYCTNFNSTNLTAKYNNITYNYNRDIMSTYNSLSNYKQFYPISIIDINGETIIPNSQNLLASTATFFTFTGGKPTSEKQYKGDKTGPSGETINELLASTDWSYASNVALPSLVTTKTFDPDIPTNYTMTQTSNTYDSTGYGHLMVTNTTTYDQSGKNPITDQTIHYDYLSKSRLPVPTIILTYLPNQNGEDSNHNITGAYQTVTNTINNSTNTAPGKITNSKTSISGYVGIQFGTIDTSSTTYQYDSYGNPTTTTTTDMTVTPNTWEKQTTGYDSKYSIYPITVYGDYNNVHDADGNVVGMSYSESFYNMFGRVEKIIDANNNITQYKYNNVGDVIIATNPDGSQSTNTYNYDTRTVITTNYDTGGNIIGGTKATYNPAGQVIETDRRDMTKTTESYDVMSTTEYDSFMRVSTQIQYLNVGKTNYNKTIYTYDDLGNLTETRTEDPSKKVLAETQASYAYEQAAPNATDTKKYTVATTKQLIDYTSTDPDTNPAGDKWYTTKTWTDINGNTVYNNFYGSYDGSNDTVAHGSQNTYTNYNFLAGTSGNGVYATSYSANYMNHISTTTSGTIKTSEAYNGLGQQIQSTDGMGNASLYTYDELGRVIKTSTPFAKDSVGRIIYKDDLTYYDDGGRVIKEKSQNNSAGTPEAYTGSQPIVFYSTLSPTYAVKEYTYDNMGRTIQEKIYEQPDTNPPAAQYTQYYYDDRGLLRRVYTGMNQPLVIKGLDDYTNPSSANNPVHVVKYEYDCYGNQKFVTDNAGNTTIYTYDDNDLTGHLESKTLPNGDKLSYTYDNMGNVIKVTGTMGNITQIESYTYNVGGQLTSATDVNGNTTSYQYDTYGNLQIINYATNGKLIEEYYEYDSKGDVTYFYYSAGNNGLFYSQNYSYSQTNGQLTQITSDDGNVSANIKYDYDDNGNITNINYLSTGVQLSTKYNLAGLAETETLKNSSSTQLMKSTYLYQLDGKVTSKDVVDNGGITSTTNYTYGQFGQLILEANLKNKVNQYWYSYHYDSWNNIKSISCKNNSITTYYGSTLCYQTGSTFSYDSTLSYNYDAANKLQNQTITDNTPNAPNGAGPQKFDFNYDDAGNLITKCVNNVVQQTYTYDALNRMTSYKNKLNVTTTYTYNAFDQRVGKSNSTVNLTSIWNGGMIVADIGNFVSPYSTENRDYVNGSSGNVGMLSGNLWYARIPNSTGSTVIGMTGSTVADIPNYDAYGNKTTGATLGTYSNPYTYDGYYQDYESGLYYLNARYYDPTTQQFTQEDPAQDGTNWYGYCGGDPVNFADPTGCSSYPGHSFRIGAKGSYVSLIQNMLMYFWDISCGPCGADGSFGPATRAAVKEFQKEQGLVQDGVVGPKTWSALFFENYSNEGGGGGGGGTSSDSSGVDDSQALIDPSGVDIIPAQNINNDTAAMLLSYMAGLRWPGEIHEAVVNYIVQQYAESGMMKNQKLGSAGICDLMRDSTQEIWEVKPITWSAAQSTYLWTKATNQINRYVSWAQKNYSNNYKAGDAIASDAFVYRGIDGTLYDVTYNYGSGGLIYYNYEPSKTKNPSRVFFRNSDRIWGWEDDPYKRVVPNYNWGPLGQAVTAAVPVATFATGFFWFFMSGDPSVMEEAFG